MKPWRLTPQAEQSLVDIAAWTFDRFGEAQALAYRDGLIKRIGALAAGSPPHPQIKSTTNSGRVWFMILRRITEHVRPKRVFRLS